MAKRPTRIYTIVWEDGHPLMDGIEVRLKGMSVRQLLRAQTISGEVAGRRGDQAAAIGGVVEELFELIGGSLLSWNLEEDDTEDPETGETVPGGPVTANTEGLMSLELEPVIEILEKWIDAVSGVADPLGDSSTSGATSAGLNIPMEDASPNPSS